MVQRMMKKLFMQVDFEIIELIWCYFIFYLAKNTILFFGNFKNLNLSALTPGISHSSF